MSYPTQNPANQTFVDHMGRAASTPDNRAPGHGTTGTEVRSGQTTQVVWNGSTWVNKY